MSDIREFNKTVIAEFRANGGQVGGQFAGAPLLLLTTSGAKSGQPRTSPLVYITDGDRYVIVASKAGAPTNPDWFHNLLANPTVTVEVGAEQFQARAEVAAGAERERLYAAVASRLPQFEEYQRQTTRQIPVVVLTRLA